MKNYSVQPLDLMQFINTKYRVPFIHERIELEGKMDKVRLEAALDTLIKVFPLLKCRYDEKDNVFAETETLTGKDLLREVDNADRDALLTEAPDLRERLIRFTLSGNTLYVTVCHLICDGAGFKQLLYLLCDIYNGTCAEDCGYLMNREFSQLTKNLSGGTGTLTMLLSMLRNNKNIPIYSGGKDARLYAAEKAIPKETMDRVHSAAKAQGATLNDVFLAAYARTLGTLYGLNRVSIPCTVDLRKYAVEKTGIANLTGTYNLNIRLRDGEMFGETLSAVSTNMRKQKNTRNDIAGPALLVSKYEKSSLKEFMKLYGGMDTSQYTDYTNLGVLDEKRLVFRGTEVRNAVGYSGVNLAPCFQIAVSSFRGETTVSALFSCADSEREKALRVVNGIVTEIHSFAQNP